MDEVLAGLREALAGEGDRAVVRLGATYQPAGGAASKVMPPTYPRDRAGDSPYVIEQRVVGGAVKETVLLDSVPSQANRCEEALLRARDSGRIALPLLAIEHRGAAPVRITSLETPHRYADAYLRDTDVEGVRFDKSEVGAAMLASSPADATGLFTWDPGSLVYGAWNSHRKGRQTRFARAYSSEIVGWEPQVGRRKAGRMDPMNLTGARKGGGEDWTFDPKSTKGAETKLSEIGHGNIAPNDQHGGVTVTGAERFGWLSLAALSRLGFGTAPHEAQLAARVCLAAYALLADRLAFAANSVWLRSGCELVTEADSPAWVLRGGEEQPFTLSVADAVELFAAAQAAASQAGLPMSTGTVVLTPTTSLGQAIDFALTKAAAEES